MDRLGAEAAAKHLARVWALSVKIADMPEGTGKGDDDLIRATHKAMFEITQGIESFGFNAAIAKLYAFTATISKSKAGKDAQRTAIMALAQLMAPMTPHLAEAIWEAQGGEGLVVTAPWPVPKEEYLVEDTVTLPIQVNGKRRAEIEVAKDADKADVEAMAMAHEAVQKALDGATPKKVIVVPGRIVNVVV